jgi:uncharacterized protein (TIGR03790 family)
MLKDRILSAIFSVAIVIAIGAGALQGAAVRVALKPDQVLVVANSDSKLSTGLAEFYASQRDIPKRNIVLVKTPQTYLISSDVYQNAVRRPIIQAMLERRLDSHIRCICVIWGVPVRISEANAKKAEQLSSLGAFHKARTKEALSKMAVYYKLLDLIGQSPKKLPPVPDNRLENVADLFASPLPAPPDAAPQAAALFQRLRKGIVRKQVKVRFMSDKTKRVLAERQLMALHRELYGLRGLIGYVRDTRTINPPDMAVLRGMLKKTEDALGPLRQPGVAKTLAWAGSKADLLKRSGGLRLVAGLHVDSDESTAKAAAKRNKTNRMIYKTTASLDSELAMLWAGDYKLQGAMGNPMHWKSRVRAASGRRPKCLMTARIDGPSASLARKMIVDSIAVEKTGLKGVFYIDSGLPLRFAKAGKTSRYRAYDNRLLRLKEFVARRTKMKMVLDTSSKLFAPGKCPDAALYAGWYSLRRYVPAFTWKRGAVGWHTASLEATDLRNPKSQQWCPQMLINGVAGTAGAVAEPFLMAFPAPDEFYPLLLTGKYSIAECYWRTCPNVSWQMTLIADPLYNPFKSNPQTSLAALPKGLAPR